jgi:molybdopterin-synthase adenylyltransferase
LPSRGAQAWTIGPDDPEERERYSRQILFAGLGEEGQERLLRAHAAIVGCGALGSFQAAALARAGVGRAHHRRPGLCGAEQPAAAMAVRRIRRRRSSAQGGGGGAALARINSSVQARGMVADLTPANIDELLGQAQVILDGTDNFETRYLVNDFALSRAIPWIYGAAVGSYGLTMPVIPGRTACLRCVYPDPPAGAQPTCETAGVLNSITAVIAALQTADALKILAGRTDAVHARLTTVDVWDGGIRQIEQPAPDPDCPACGARDFAVSGRPPARAGQPVRAQRGADPRARAAARSGAA